MTVSTRVFLYKKMSGRFAMQPKNSGSNNEVAVRRGSTVVGREFYNG